ncbi:MAG TPA: head GIN domain-containing protein [Prolixibacteraceae bacterium]|nr:head GIN domain-containing protein [Prolixibacteraceae bacterium]
MRTQNILLGIALFLAVVQTSCIRVDLEGDWIHGKGSLVERELTLEEFSAIENSGSFNVIVSQGSDQKVVAVGNANIIEHLNTSVEDGFWNICLDRGSYSFFDLTIYVTIPEVESLELSGSGDINLNEFNQDLAPEIIINGSGSFEMNEFESARELVVNMNSSGSFYAERHVNCFEKLTVRVSGSGSFHGYNIEVNDCKASTSGSGSCYVYAAGTLDASISGSGSIRYKGSPEVFSNDNGSGRLVHVD